MKPKPESVLCSERLAAHISALKTCGISLLMVLVLNPVGLQFVKVTCHSLDGAGLKSSGFTRGHSSAETRRRAHGWTLKAGETSSPQTPVTGDSPPGRLGGCLLRPLWAAEKEPA